MPSKSVYSPRYIVPEFWGLKVRRRVWLLEALLPIPEVEEDAIMRACDALYAVGAMSPRLIAQLKEDIRLSGHKPKDYWVEVATRIEAHFQGNFMSFIHNHCVQQKKRKVVEQAAAVLAEIRRLAASEAMYTIIQEFGMADENPQEYYEEVLRNLKAGYYNNVAF